MFKAPRDLRARLGLSLTSLALATAALLGLLLWFTHIWLESYTLGRLLGRELELYIESGAQPEVIDEARTGLRFYRPGQFPFHAPPQEVQALGLGQHRDFELHGRAWHVLVADAAPGDRAWLLYDIAEIEHIERLTGFGLVAGVLAVGLLAWLASGRVARLSLKPLDDLVARIRSLPVAGARLSHHHGEGELGVMVDALNTRMAEVDALVTRERAFAAAAAHELRTPLTAIRGAAELADAAPEYAAAARERIGRAVVQAAESLDALLALSRAHETAPPLAHDLARLLPLWAEPYLDAARNEGTALDWQLAPVTVQAPAGVLAVIFTNLLRNSLRAARGLRVTVQLNAQGLTVSDAGEGIPADELPKVFEPGTRGKNGGSGMGLYISKVLAERQGWSLQLTSIEGQGTQARLGFTAPSGK